MSGFSSSYINVCFRKTNYDCDGILESFRNEIKTDVYAILNDTLDVISLLVAFVSEGLMSLAQIETASDVF